MSARARGRTPQNPPGDVPTIVVSSQRRTDSYRGMEKSQNKMSVRLWDGKPTVGTSLSLSKSSTKNVGTCLRWDVNCRDVSGISTGALQNVGTCLGWDVNCRDVAGISAGDQQNVGTCLG